MLYTNFENSKEDVFPLTYLQEDMFAGIQLKQCDYYEEIRLTFKNCINFDMAKRALEQVMFSQQNLRTVFRIARGKKPVQVLLRNTVLPLYSNSAPEPNIETEPWNLVIDSSGYIITFQYSHLIMDGWSMSLFWKQFMKYYSQLMHYGTVQLERTITLREYHNRMKEDEENITDDEVRFWKKQIVDKGTFLADYISYHHKKNEKFRITLSDKQTQIVRSNASRLRVTLAIMIYAAWARVLKVYTGNSQVSMKLVMSGRDFFPDLDNTLGMFIQTLPICVELNGDWRKECEQICAFINHKYVKRANAGGRAKKVVGDAFCDSLVVVENYPIIINDNINPIEKIDYYERPSFPFTLQVYTSGRISCELTTNKEELQGCLEGLLHYFIHVLCGEDEVLEAEEWGVKVENNKGTLVKQMVDACHVYHDKVAIVDGNFTITFGEILSRAKGLSLQLQKMGIKQGEAVGVCMERSLEQLLTVYSLVLCGAVYVPFSVMPKERANHMIHQAGITCIISKQSMKEWDCKWICWDNVNFVESEVEIEFPDDTGIAYILFTSGSSGMPKGCRISHRAIYNRLRWNAEKLGLSTETRQLYKTPVTFDVSLIEMFSLFFTGLTLFILPEKKEKAPDILLDYIENNQINYIHFVPSMLIVMMDYIAMFNERKYLESLCILVCSGEILSKSLVDKVYQYVSNKKMKIVNLYGPTETAVDVSYEFCNREDIISTAQVPIGRPIYNTGILLLDENLDRVPRCTNGELFIVGDNLGSGYCNEPELSNKVFLTLPDGEKAYRTGDIGYRLPDGRIVVTGRIDDQIKWNGVRIEPSEIEYIALKSNLIQNVCVILPEKYSKNLFLCYTAKEKCDEELYAWMFEQLPAYMCPNKLVFFEQFPLTDHGKIKKENLIELISKNHIQEDFTETTTIEEMLSEIWAGILEKKKTYSSNDNFFAYGGTSLTLIQMVIEVKKKWHVRLDTGRVYENPVLSVVANQIEEKIRESENREELVETNLAGRSEIAVYLWENPNSTAYNMPVILELKSEVDVVKAKHAFHKVLTTYKWLNITYKPINRVFYASEIQDEFILPHLRFESMQQVEDYCTDFIKPFSWGERLYRAEFLSCGLRNFFIIDILHLLCDQNGIHFLFEAWTTIMNGGKIENSRLIEQENIVIPSEEKEKQLGFLFENLSVLYPKQKGMIGRHSFELNQKEVDEFLTFSKSQNISMFHMLLIGFTVFCYYITNRRVFTIGSNYIDDKLSKQYMQLNLMSINISLDPEAMNIKDIKEKIMHEIADNMNCCGTRKKYDVMFIREEEFANSSTLRYVKNIKKINKEVKNPLSLFYSEIDRKLLFTFIYDKGLFDEGTIILYGKYFCSILEDIIKSQDISIVNFNSRVEMNKYLRDKYYTIKEKSYPEVTIQEQFINVCKEKPLEPVVFCNEKMMMRKELLYACGCVAGFIKERVHPGEKIGVLFPPSIEYFVAIFGIMMAGACFVPLDPMQPENRLRQLISTLKISFCFGMSNLCLDGIECIELPENGNDYTEEVISAEDIYCIFTSGSTGEAKACIVKQNNILNYLFWAENIYCRGQKQTFAFYTSPAVDMTITSTLLPVLFGHRVVVYPQKAETIYSVIKDKRISIIKTTPSHLRLLRNIDVKAQVECLIVGGEQFSTDLAKEMSKCFGGKTRIYNEYGPTEAAVACMVCQYSNDISFSVVPIGRPIPNMCTTIIGENGQLCLPGVIGELVLEGANVISGYYGNNIPFKKGETIYKKYYTGDMARLLSDGRIMFEGRQDNQYKINGYRVELAEISKIAKNIEQIEDAEALMIEGHLVLCCVKKERAKVNEIEIRKELFKRLPRYMMPGRVNIVDYIPLSASGKIDLKKLEELCEIRVDKVDNTISVFLRSCWEAVLGHSAFSDEDGFFEAGGNSISILDVLEKIKVRFPDLTVADLFCYPSINSLTKYLGGEENIEKNIIEKEKYTEEHIAIIGVGFVLPQADNLHQLREIFSRGKSMMHVVSGQRRKDEQVKMNNLGVKEGNYRFGMAASLEHIDLFDAAYFNITGDEAQAMDPAHKIFLTAVDYAFEDAGFSKEQLKGRNCAVVVATPTNIGFDQYLKKYYPNHAELAPLNDVPSSLVGRVQFCYDLSGPSYMLDCACSSGLEAVHDACTMLRSHQCEMALVGGVNLVNTVDTLEEKRSPVLSAHHHAEPFSAEADGTARGEGAICIVLQRETVAKKDNRYVYASIYGSASNSDGFSSSLTSPNGRAQQNLLNQAWLNASVTAEDITLIEAHGTATKLGDYIELQALNSAMKISSPGHCALSASKAFFGHLDSISGLLGILKCILSIEYAEIYPMPGMSLPIESNWLQSPFYIPMRVSEWNLQKGQKAICGISSFGLSGTNVHVVIGSELKEKKRRFIGHRLNLKRYWLPNEPDITVKIVDLKQDDIERQKWTETDIYNEVITKVSSLFGKDQIDGNVPVLNLGFDSVTIIQLRIFIRNTFNYECEIRNEDTIGEIAKRIALNINSTVKNEIQIDHITKKENTVDNQLRSNDSWFNFQIRSKLEHFAHLYFERTKKSKEYLQEDKIEWANGRFMTGYTAGLEVFSYPVLIDHANGAHVWDIDGNEYIDFAMGFGALFFGYNHPGIANAVGQILQNGIVLGGVMERPFKLAARICEATGVERVSFCNSGTEAVMNLIRIARAATNRNSVVVFKGAFHGTYDPIYVQEDFWRNGVKPIPRSIGTPLHYMDDIVMLPYGDDYALDYVKEHGTELAAVLVEPVQSRHPGLRPKEFIRKLRELTYQSRSLLIFDEVITGFRSGLRGAQAYYGVEADLVSYGKIIGGGFPIGVFGGKAVYMDLIDHRGGLNEVGNSTVWVSTGGTFNGHPVAVAAADAVLTILEKEGDSIYKRVNAYTEYITTELNDFFKTHDMKLYVEYYCSQFIFLGEEQTKLRILQYFLIYEGIFVWEGGTCFVSAAHSENDIKRFIYIVKKCTLKMYALWPEQEQIQTRVSVDISSRDYEKIKDLVVKKQNIETVEAVDKELLRIISYNIGHRSLRLDVSTIIVNVNREINEIRLQNIINKLINHHKILRSAISWRKLETPILMTYQTVNCPLSTLVCNSLDEYEKAVINICRERKEKGFQCEDAPLLKFDLIKFKKQNKIILSYFNSWFDGWSADLLFKQMNLLLEDKRLPDEINWMAYNAWRIQKNEEVKKYWKGIHIDETKGFERPNDGKAYYQEKIYFTTELNDKIDKWLVRSNGSRTALYLAAMANAENTETIVTSFSGRTVAIDGILDSIGCFSGLELIKATNIDMIEQQLKMLNELPICNLSDIAKYTGCSYDFLNNCVLCNGVIILNQLAGNKDGIGEIIQDESFVPVPRRCYIIPEKEVLLIGDNVMYPQEEAVTLLQKFLQILEEFTEEKSI